MIFLSRRRSRAQPTIGFVKWLKNINHQTKPALALEDQADAGGLLFASPALPGCIWQWAGKPGV
ncbi:MULTISPECIES: hypothetical protein [unclassified Acidovorax]|uniref:hypothetical protein n=1 Tax=unclassified Acidovorax TaxID=2684926 RepID=UPI0010F8C5DC|nr:MULTISPECIES: hypothetical protein [unclassified Acidovorax]MCZ8218149.1 hypothetical protein [Acidovorax sp.]